MNACPYCDSIGDYYFKINSRSYMRCLTCDLIYLDIPQSYNDVVDTYRENYFERYSVDQLQGVRVSLYEHILDLLQENRTAGRLLDVGTGCGFFLEAAKKGGWHTRGVEPSIQSAEVARRQNDLAVFCGTLSEYQNDGLFDAITFINVLDHSAMPWLEIERASKLLRTGGLIYLRFPNGFLHSRSYLVACKYGLGESVRKFLVFHNYSFTPRYIRKLLYDYGLLQTAIRNSPPSEGDPHGLFLNQTLASYCKRTIYSIAKFTTNISRRKLFLGTSLEVTAVKSDYPSTC